MKLVSVQCSVVWCRSQERVLMVRAIETRLSDPRLMLVFSTVLDLACLMQDHNIQNISRADWQHFSCKYFREWDSSTTLPVENRIMHLCHLCHLCQQKTSSSIHWYPLKIVLVVKKFQAPRLEIHYIPLRIRWLRVFSVHVSANEMIVGQSCGLITRTSRRGSGRCSTQLILHKRSQLVPCHPSNACGPWKFIWS